MTALDVAKAYAARWRHLRRLADAYATALPQYSDWEVVLRFYAGLHLLQAYFSTKNPRFQAARHFDRIQAINASPELTKVRGFKTAYRMLQDVSEQVRYDPAFGVNATHVGQARQNLMLVERTLEGKVERALAN